jgi:ribosomal protein L7/L12
MISFLIFLGLVIGVLVFLYILGSREEGKQKNEWTSGQTPAQLDWSILLSDEIQQYLPDNKIMAIKRYRELTDVGLKEAKDAVEYVMAHPDRVPSGAKPSSTPKRKPPPASGNGEIDWNVLLSPEMQPYLPDRKIDAIKLYRERTGVGLKEAKDAVDEYFANPGDVPAKIRHYDLAEQQASGIRDLLRQGKREEARKTYQAFTGVDQFTASEAIDALQEELRTEVERYDRLHQSDSPASLPNDTYEDDQQRRQS